VELRIGWDAALWSFSLAFVLCTVISWVYVYTYQGLSYSRGFTQTLALGGLVSAMVMLAIGTDVARGLGLVGALTVIRFRTTLKDTRDLLFVFASLAIGVACGVQSFSIAVMGTVVYGLAAIYVSWSGFGSRRHFDAVLRLHLPALERCEEAFKQVLRQHCRTFVLINLREVGATGGVHEHSYHIKMRDPDLKGELITHLNKVPGLSGVSLLMQDTTIEP
jgi:hypothetical protein